MNDKELCAKLRSLALPVDTAWLAADRIEELLANQSTAVAVAMTKKPRSKAGKRFVKPEVLDLAIYFHERGHLQCNDEAEKFFDHYESNGWKVGGKGPMKCWKSSVRNWMRNYADGMFAAPEKGGMNGAGVDAVKLFDEREQVNDDLAFLQQTRARALEHQS